MVRGIITNILFRCLAQLYPGNVALRVRAMQKEKVQQVLDAFSDDVDLDAFLEEVYLLKKLELGEQQIASGEVVSHTDAKKRLEKWLA